MSPADVRFAVRLTPRSSATRIEDVLDGVLRVRVAAPAVGGAANAALLQCLADALRLSKRDVRIVSGATNRQKLVAVDGVDRASLVARWPGLRV